MRIIYIPEDFHLIVNNVTKTLLWKYENTRDIYLNMPSYFEMINIILSVEKDEIQISSIFNYDISKFTIVETQDNYYITLDMYTLCFIAYKSTIKTDFSEILRDKIDGIIPNIFDSVEVVDMFNKMCKSSVRSINYSHRYLDILDDMYTFTKSYMDILLRSSDLSRDDLNKLFKLTVKYLLPINKILDIKSLKNTNVVNNGYNLYRGRFYDYNQLSNSDGSKPNIIQYLSCLSKDDKYTNNNVVIEFKTSIDDINKFLHSTCNSYRQTIPHVTNILPVSTMADAFMSISIADVLKYSDSNEEISHLKDLMLFKNTHMHFAFYGTSEGEISI